MPVYEDPLPGWTSNIYGPVGVMLATGLGIMRVFLCNSDVKSDMVPVDYCVNSLICCAWDVYKQRNSENENVEGKKYPIYNYSTGVDKHVTWKEFSEYSLQYKYPLKDALWATINLNITNFYVYYILWFILHTIPGYLIDTYLVLLGKKPKMVKTYEKIFKFSKVLAPFSTRQWTFKNDNVKSLWRKLNQSDQKLFPFNIAVVNYKQLISATCTGVKIYILKENLDNVEEEIKRFERLTLIHKIVKYGFQMTGLIVASAILRWLIFYCF